MMRHRGPDGAGLWTSADHAACLAHRRLAIIGLGAAGTQPLRSSDGTLVISFNGEIYNYRELRQQLAAAGAEFHTTTDTEVIIEAYRQWGVDGLSRLRGMFAFALWDDRKRGLLLARDGFGIKPLYVADDGATLVVSSEFRALRQFLGDRISPDLGGQLSYFLRGCLIGAATPVREIRMLPSGSWLWRDQTASKSGKFFDPLEKAVACAAMPPSPAAARDRSALLRAALSDSVAYHLVADVPVGLFLSAGVDSTAIAQLVAPRASGQLKAITVGATEWRETARDEVPEAAALTGAFGFDHQVAWLDRAVFADEAQAIMTAMDVPSIDGINTYFVSKAAADRGLKVALSGLGGDELFNGYSTASDVRKLRQLAKPFGRSPALARLLRSATAPLASRLTSPKYASIPEYGHSLAGAFLLRRGVFMPWELQTGLSQADFDAALQSFEAEHGFDGRYEHVRSPTLGVALAEMQLYMRDQLLRDSDWAGMAHSLEIRVPLVDTVLYVQLLPLLASALVTKADVGVALNGAVQKAVSRPKTGFGLPVGEWVRSCFGFEGRHLRGWAKFLFAEWCRINRVPNAFAHVTRSDAPMSTARI